LADIINITLKEIADVLEGKLKGKIVHFGSCSTLRTSESNITDFINRTECTCISGYKKEVEYIASTAFELLYFEMLQRYCSYSRTKSAIKKNYPTLAESLRFIMT
jgi:hypothetical protein